jgi:hypothetical protein
MTTVDVELYLTPGQIKKAQKKVSFMLTANQLGSDPNVLAKMDIADAKRIFKNRQQGKGARVAPSRIVLVEEKTVSGGKIRWKKLSKQISRGAKSVARDFGRSVADDVRAETGINIRSQKALTGDLKDIGNEIKRQSLNRLADEVESETGLNVRNADNLKSNLIKSAKMVGKKGVDYGIDGLSAALSVAPGVGPMGAMASAAGGEWLKKQIGDEIDGAGVRRKGRFVKGSQAARDHMARLRSMRGGAVNAKGIFEPLGSGPYQRINLIKGGSFLPY